MSDYTGAHDLSYNSWSLEILKISEAQDYEKIWIKNKQTQATVDEEPVHIKREISDVALT